MAHCLKMRSCAGFTLIEMSIVLLVLGLLVGGVVAGQSLIRNSALRAISADMEKYVSGIHQFQEKYNALPGDFKTATALWGSAAGNCTQSSTTFKRDTCNGDGNGIVGDSQVEMATAWQQLALSEFIEGAYTGNFTNWVVGTNLPAGSIEGTGYLFFAGTAIYNGLSSFGVDVATRHAMYFGKNASGGSGPFDGAITPAEAKVMDTKLDDAAPGTGLWRASLLNASACATSTNPATAAYALSSKDDVCALALIMGF